MSIKLLTVDGNWGDEMDFNSHLIVQEGDENWKMLEKIKSYTKEQMEDTRSVSISVGSNEDIEYNNAYDAFRNIQKHDITEEECEVIRKYFGRRTGALSIGLLLEFILEALGCEID